MDNFSLIAHIAIFKAGLFVLNRHESKMVVGQFDCGRLPALKIDDANMPNVRTKIPMVEVIAPDGRKSLWVAAVAKANAVAAVKQVIPANYIAALTQRRLTITRKSAVLRPGEVRRVRL